MQQSVTRLTSFWEPLTVCLYRTPMMPCCCWRTVWQCIHLGLQTSSIKCKTQEKKATNLWNWADCRCRQRPVFGYIVCCGSVKCLRKSHSEWVIGQSRIDHSRQPTSSSSQSGDVSDYRQFLVHSLHISITPTVVFHICYGWERSLVCVVIDRLSNNRLM